MTRVKLILTAGVSLLLLASAMAFAQGTAFTYQGKLTDSGTPSSGQFDFQFKLFDTQTVGTGNPIGSPVAVPNVTVANGLFSVSLDFGACTTCFNGAARFLEIAVKPTTGGTFTTLGPRQPITANPYAIRTSTATAADGLSVACVNCVTSGQIASVNGSAVSGAIPVASVPSGSGNYIQNTTSLQATSDFNISGNGTAGGTLSANFINATTQFNLGGQRVLNAPGQNNLFAGLNAGTSNNGYNNAFFGAAAGFANTSGFQNAFFGNAAGHDNTSGGSNAFFGNAAGANNTSGGSNAFFGFFAGNANTSGGSNAFFGEAAGGRNTIGQNNTFIGAGANFDNASPTGDNNTLLGAFSIVTSGSSNATAIGFRAKVEQDNSLVLGGITGVNSGTDTKVGIGTTTPGAHLDVQRDQDTSTSPETARFTTYGAGNEILSRASGGTRAAPTGTPNGTLLLQLGATGHNGNGFVTAPRAAIEMTAAEAWAPGAAGTLMRFNTTANGTAQILTRMIITSDGKVGIGTPPPDPDQTLTVNGGASKPGGGSWATFSDARLKTVRGRFTPGLQAVLQLQPIRYEYKSENALGIQADGEHIGFVAQEVEKVIPEAVSPNGRGYLLVNNDPILWAMLNAVKEQQAQIAQQQAQIKTQQTSIQQQQQQMKQQQIQIDRLKKMVCLDHPNAELCR